MLSELGIKRRIVMLSACYSGIFVPYLATRDTALITAAAADKTSFGCQADNDWTFFGDALVNNALRKPASFSAASAEATRTIANWEGTYRLEPSQPQVVIGDLVATWLPALESRTPKAATAPVGQPSISSFKR